MSTYLRPFVSFCSELIYTRIRRDMLLAAMLLGPNYQNLRKNKRKRLLKQIKKFLTFRLLSVIILMSVLTGCGTTKSSSPSIQSCVDLTTYVNNGKTAAQVISKERICEIERLRSIGINIGEQI